MIFIQQNITKSARAVQLNWIYWYLNLLNLAVFELKNYISLSHSVQVHFHTPHYAFTMTAADMFGLLDEYNLQERRRINVLSVPRIVWHRLNPLLAVAVSQICIWHFVFVNFDYILQSVDANKDWASCWRNNSCLVPVAAAERPGY